MTSARALVALLAIAVLAAGLPACGAVTGADHDPPVQAPEPGDEIPGDSIYNLDLPLVDQDGRRLVLADLAGHPIVAAMIYSACTTVCPRVTQEMKAVEAQLSAAGRQDARFVLFSLDPGRDTPRALREFAAAHRLDLSRWRLVAAPEDEVRTLSAVLGVKYKLEGNGEIAHSALIAVIDRRGVVRHRQLGYTQDPRALLAAVGGVM
ncbi:MAG TPA: SCO family protein [Vicinamibacterales bacterium]|nr:SCO family protein [Vicinamibacterales bacterium]